MTNRWIKQLIETADRTDVQMPWATGNIGLNPTFFYRERAVSKGETDAQ